MLTDEQCIKCHPWSLQTWVSCTFPPSHCGSSCCCSSRRKPVCRVCGKGSQHPPNEAEVSCASIIHLKKIPKESSSYQPCSHVVLTHRRSPSWRCRMNLRISGRFDERAPSHLSRTLSPIKATTCITNITTMETDIYPCYRHRNFLSIIGW